MPKFKSFAVKADGISADGGTITGYASTWDREPDCYGDVVAKGAFTETLEAWGERGAHIPFLFGHRTDDPKYNIGWCEAEEDERGLLFVAHLDADSELAQYVRKLYKEGRIYQFSFAYDVLDSGEVELEDGTKACELRRLDLFEISAVQIPANQHADVVEVKSSETAAAEPDGKAGRRNSKADEDSLRELLAMLDECREAVTRLIGDQDEHDDEPDPDGRQDGADEDEDDAEDGEGEATPKGREVDDRTRLEAYRKALLGAYERNID